MLKNIENTVEKIVTKHTVKQEEKYKKRLTELFGDQSKLLEDIKINKSVLVTSISKMKEDNPTLVVQWNFGAFDVNRSRDGDPLHTIDNLIKYIQNSGGEDLFDLHTMFIFQTERDFYECVRHFPAWSRRTIGLDDVATTLKIVHHNTYEVFQYEFAFNWP
ncbi:unnamed protein product [Rhizophagus irregularis]|uniref:Uncharacterized protein n=1 Tax=Rhizophagus irregularis TaxID=588596 RepID=A0A2I1H2Q3_9GLOM|nr:hypothetical protein RhiirA4_471219 [Rhizophagus irregularis]CAB4404942.1 unnamed protein product [Rhizophagus irregularis]CAB4405749.1 unnamed protein product [Rhizophagus irregularis]